MEGKHRDLDILEDIRHQEVEWKIEWVAWFFMIALVVANLLGFFGRGVFNEGHVGEAGAALQVDYQKRERYKAASALDLHIDPALAGTSPRVTIGQEFASRVRISEIVPEPTSMEAGADHHVYEFSAQPGAPVTIRIFFEPFESGITTTRIGLEDTLEYEFRQWFLP